MDDDSHDDSIGDEDKSAVSVSDYSDGEEAVKNNTIK